MRSDWFHEIRSSDLFFNLLDSSSGCILKFPIPKKHLYNSFVVFSPNKTTTWTLGWTECSTVFWVIKPTTSTFFFFAGQKTHTMLQLHLGVLFLSAWPGPWVCLGEKFFFPASMKPGSHRRVSPMLRRNAAQDFPSMELGTSKFRRKSGGSYCSYIQLPSCKGPEKTQLHQIEMFVVTHFGVLLGDSSKCWKYGFDSWMIRKQNGVKRV